MIFNLQVEIVFKIKVTFKHNHFAALFVAVFFTSIAAYAADPTYNSYRDKGAVRGHDVVAYFSLPEGAKAVEGKPEYMVIWQDVPWYFSTEENLLAFKKSPESYAPQFGGYCAFAASKNFTTSIRPDSWTIYDGKLYLNHNGASRKLFLKDIEASLKEANANWPNVLTRCEKRDNCREPAPLPVARPDQILQSTPSGSAPQVEL